MTPLDGIDHRRAGSGEPLVAIHGIGSTWQVWTPVLAALEAHHDVLALSLPGYGRSAPLRDRPTVPALTAAVEQSMDAAGFDTAHLVGNSLGGWIAAELAARGRARSVVAFSPAGLWTPRELRYSVAVLRASRVGARVLARWADAAVATPLRRRLVFAHVCARPERMDPGSAALQLRLLAESPSFSETLRWTADGPRPSGLERIGVPFRVAWGGRDLLLPPRQGPRWAKLVPGGELVALPGLGHVPMFDDPEAVSRTVLEVTCGRAGPTGDVIGS
jgi:pimeloyl-ACP methyl ester carboxylesterase